MIRDLEENNPPIVYVSEDGWSVSDPYRGRVVFPHAYAVLYGILEVTLGSATAIARGRLVAVDADGAILQGARVLEPDRSRQLVVLSEGLVEDVRNWQVRRPALVAQLERVMGPWRFETAPRIEQPRLASHVIYMTRDGPLDQRPPEPEDRRAGAIAERDGGLTIGDGERRWVVSTTLPWIHRLAYIILWAHHQHREAAKMAGYEPCSWLRCVADASNHAIMESIAETMGIRTRPPWARRQHI